jgi:hypothetical protein
MTGVGTSTVSLSGTGGFTTTVSAATGGVTGVDTSVVGGATSMTQTGGATAITTGGVTATGGKSSTGGTAATGGKSSTGGTAATGGKSSTGGTAATGGKSSTGGTAATGGSSSTSTACPSTCGSSGAEACDCTITTGEFSFFVISWPYIKKVGGADGLGGNLGGLSGADAHCKAAALAANANDKHLWKAFLSQVANSSTGATTINAIDRIGTGRWYSQGASTTADDGLAMATDLTGLNSGSIRPSQASTTTVYAGGTENYRSKGPYTFKNCLTDEYGICPLSYSDPAGDNHDVLTGSDIYGKATTSGMGTGTTALAGTCDNWTNSTAGYGSPVFGHIWPRNNSTSSMEMGGWIRAVGHQGVNCGQTVNQTETMSVGSGVGMMGGYGAFYCFAYSIP